MFKAFWALLLSGLCITGALLFIIFRAPFADPWLVVGLSVAALVCALVALVLKRRLSITLFEHLGVRIVYVPEQRQMWSTHITGFPRYFWLSQLSRLNPMTPKAKRRVRLLKAPIDRQRVNELSLEGFELMLDQFHTRSGAVIVSASVLNHPERQSERLTDRIRAVELRPMWRYRHIRRKLGPIESTLNRFIYAWPVRAGERYWKVIAPGIVVWRSIDPEPDIGRLDQMASGTTTAK